MALEVVGSNPTIHPTKNIGVSPSGKARDFDSRIRRFEPCHPSQNFIFDSLAQLAEHLTFNQGVRSSNLRRVTKKNRSVERFFMCFLLLNALLNYLEISQIISLL